MIVTSLARLRRLAAGVAASLALALAGAAPAAANPGALMFKQLTDPMPRAQKVQFCAFVARNGAEMAGESPDPARRMARATLAAQLTARLASELAKATARLSSADLAAAEREHGQAMGLLSYAPSDELVALIRAEGEGADIGGLFVEGVMKRCDALADRLKLPPAPDIAVSAPAFRWKGAGAAETFASTGLVPFAERLCTGAGLTAADFAAAPLAERGKDGVSLIDWAMQCGDKAGFGALIGAGADLEARGAFGDPPLVRAADKADLFWLDVLLAAGASPDAMGARDTALWAAYDTMEPTGGAAWQRLRAAGANLNFPDARGAIWSAWTLYADWEQILENWSAFDSDPVHLARGLSMDLDRFGGPRGNPEALYEIKARLIADYGVCFPLGNLYGAPKDERGYLMQPGCMTTRRPER
jgi:hypothetical protein